ncbi:MAG TPA: uroporphyrinogen decarboxylase family protein [Candidatus Eremiobacteraeota bacterium]|nr:MAG: Uroporphyrinogen decarboxylase [bacterium ADurb.Bin363]HPZ07890.1 uroporphyrinogen decarboxylase family protein [Candidatus Eremiobacteraeota bacterium]
MLTRLEKIKSAVSLKSQKDIPVVPQITYTTHQLTGVKMLDALKDAGKMAQALIAGFEEIGYDGIYSGWESSFNIMAEAMGCEMKYPENDVPCVSRGIIKNSEDLEKVKVPDPYTSPRLLLHLETLKIIRKHVGLDVPIFNYIPGPLTLAGLLMGTDSLMMNIIKKPDLVHSTCRITARAAMSYAEAKLSCGGDIMVVADPTASCSLISPKMFETFSFPYLKEIFTFISKKDGIPSLHICGNTTPILDKMADTGARIIELDHMVSLKDAKKKIGHRVCIQGNVDPSKVLLMGDPEEVYKVSKKCIEDTAEGGGFILSTGCEVPLNTPVENVKAMVRAGRET